jgi:hypothetical protein
MTDEYCQRFEDLIKEEIYNPYYVHPLIKVRNLKYLEQQIVCNQQNGNLTHNESAGLRINIAAIKIDLEIQANN